MTIFSKSLLLMSMNLSLLFSVTVSTITTNGQELLPALNTQFYQNYSVISKIGLNIRNKDCELQGRLAYGTLLKHRERGSNTPILCVIDNVVYTMYPVQFNATDNSALFVAVTYLRQIASEYDESASIFNLTVNSPIGVNVRSETCEYLSRLPDGAKLTLNKHDSLNTVNCELAGQTYAMTKFKLPDGSSGYIATSFVL